LEVLNTRLPDGQKDLRQTLRDLLAIPRMSTFAIGAIINRGVFSMPPDCCFVNVGVWHGYSLLAGMKGNPDRRCIGVDNFSLFGGPREQFLNRFYRYRSADHHFYDLDYNKYFSRIHVGNIGLYFYDGPHDYENQLQGLRAAEPYFSDHCIILVDDTNDAPPRQATMDFVSQAADDYDLLLDETTLFNKHPTFWNGLMILQKIGRSAPS
jgi:hypothetical protein